MTHCDDNNNVRNVPIATTISRQKQYNTHERWAYFPSLQVAKQLANIKPVAQKWPRHLKTDAAINQSIPFNIIDEI